MGKGVPHHKLATVKTLALAGDIRSTMSALTGAARLGLGFRAIVNVVMSLSTSDFYKSMTTYADHRVWHDVYRPQISAGKIYLKLTVPKEVLVVSFKEQ